MTKWNYGAMSFSRCRHRRVRVDFFRWVDFLQWGRTRSLGFALKDHEDIDILGESRPSRNRGDDSTDDCAGRGGGIEPIGHRTECLDELAPADLVAGRQTYALPSLALLSAIRLARTALSSSSSDRDHPISRTDSVNISS